MVSGWTSQSTNGTKSRTPDWGKGHQTTEALPQARELTSTYLDRLFPFDLHNYVLSLLPLKIAVRRRPV